MKRNILLVMLTTILTTMATLFVVGKVKNNGDLVGIKANSDSQVFPTAYTIEGKTQSAAAGGIDFETAAAKAVPAVVHIKTTTKITTTNNPFGGQFSDPFFDQFFGDAFGRRQIPRNGSGSGVVISADGYVVTNNHVVAGADEVTVTFNDRETKTAKVVGTDPATDIALLKIDANNLPFMEFANSDQVKLGQWVLAVGYPLTLDATVTAGIVSAKSRALGINRQQSNNAIESFIQTDAAVNQGNSGGALVNTSGQLIGINSAIASPTGSYAGYSYAIPSNIVRKVANDLKQFGSVQRGYLGVEVRDHKSLSPEDIKKYGLDKQEGVYVNGFMEPSAAKDAGLQKGDIITKINGANIRTVPDLMAQVALYKPGDNLGVSYVRNGKTYNTSVQLKNARGNTDVVKQNSGDYILGASIRDISASEKTKYRVKSGLVIDNIGNGELKKQTNIRNGFIITHINEQPVKGLQDLCAALAEANLLYLSGMYPGNNGIYHYGIRLDAQGIK